MKAVILDTDDHARDNASLKALCDAIATVVVSHIIANAVVTVAPGQTIAGTGGGPAPVVGSTTSPGVGTIT